MAGKERKYIAFPVYAGVTPLDLVGPLTVLRNLAIGTRYRTVVVGERSGTVPTGTRMGLAPTATFADVPEPWGVVVPGAGPATPAAMEDDELVGYVRSAARTAELVGSTGTGALVLAAAGLLEGRRVAIHWAWADQLERYGATAVRDPWVEDGRFMTAAGGAAGIDMMLALLGRLASPSASRLAQLFMEYDPEPPFGPLGPDRGDPGLGALLRNPRRRAAHTDHPAEER